MSKINAFLKNLAVVEHNILRGGNQTGYLCGLKWNYFTKDITTGFLLPSKRVVLNIPTVCMARECLLFGL